MWRNMFQLDTNVLRVYTDSVNNPARVWIQVTEIEPDASKSYADKLSIAFSKRMNNVSVDTRECDAKGYFCVFER